MRHTFTRRSSDQVTSEALAWQTTSRSRGRVNCDRSQKLAGKGSKPSEVKKLSPNLTIDFASIFFAARVFETSSEASSLYGSTRSKMSSQLCAHMFPVSSI